MATGSESASVVYTSDPLLASVALPFHDLYHPFGFAARIETNDRLVLKAAEANWRGSGPRFPEPPGVLRAIVSGSGGGPCPDSPVYRAQNHLLSLTAGRDNFGCCDLERGFGALWLSPAVAAETEFLRYCFLEGMVASMIECLYLVSVHAACVARNGSGILLCGDSGAGKSSLAYACARRGWTYVSDDCSSLVRKSAARSVIGMPEVVRFRENAPELFPELAGRKPRFRARRDPSIEIRTGELPGIRTAFETRVDHIVFLHRRPGFQTGAHLCPFPQQEARKRLRPVVWPSEPGFAAAREAALDRLLSAGIHELRYRDLDPAVDRLEELAGRGD